MAQRGLAGIHVGDPCAIVPPRGLLKGGGDPKAGSKAELRYFSRLSAFFGLG